MLQLPLSLQLVLIAAGARAAPSSPYSCPFRQLAYDYANDILAGRGLGRVELALNLSTTGPCAAQPATAVAHAAAAAPRNERPNAAAGDYVGWSPHGASAESLQRTVFVDGENGEDSADGGSLDRPLRTLRAAQVAARRLAPGPRTVVLRGGTHWLGGSGPLVLTTADSGTHFTSFDGEEAVISGGISLGNTTHHPMQWRLANSSDAAGGVWSAALPPEVPADFGSLYVDDLRQMRARHPNVVDPTAPGGFGLDQDGPPLLCPNGSVPSQHSSNVQIVDAENASTVLYTGASFDSEPHLVPMRWPKSNTIRQSWHNFGGYFNGSSRRFDHTFNTDHWGSDSIQGVRFSSRLADLPAWANASSAVVHMMHPGQWANWMFSVADRPSPGTLRFRCRSFGKSGGSSFGDARQPRHDRPCTTQDPTEQVMVVGGWQEARGACSNGELIWKLPSFKWPFFVENVRGSAVALCALQRNKTLPKPLRDCGRLKA